MSDKVTGMEYLKMVAEATNDINFEEDQREDLNSVGDAKSLSDQVVKLKSLEDRSCTKRKRIKRTEETYRFSFW